MVVRYVEEDTTVFDQPESNPRAWTYASDLLLTADENGTDPQTVMTALEGILGSARAAALWKLVEGGEQGLSARDILSSYPSHQARLRQWIRKGKLDLVNASIHLLMKQLQVKSDFERMSKSTKQRTNFLAFIGDLPGDLQIKSKAFCDEWGHDYPSQNGKGGRKP